MVLAFGMDISSIFGLPLLGSRWRTKVSGNLWYIKTHRVSGGKPRATGYMWSTKGVGHRLLIREHYFLYTHYVEIRYSSDSIVLDDIILDCACVSL